MRHIADEQQALHQRLETVVQQLEQVREVDVLKAKEAKMETLMLLTSRRAMHRGV